MRTRLLSVLVTLPMAACFLPSLSDLTGGTTDASLDAGAFDATTESGPPKDGATPDGGSPGDADASSRCAALHGPSMVLVPQGYCIDSTEVTNSQYREFVLEADVNAQTGACAWNKTSPAASSPTHTFGTTGTLKRETMAPSRA